ncbi:MAG: GNAT family N-acetyltransferase [Deltaproteobacteria bacterium]|jgi:ribosomal protein S18 acetylase RimI-like enzyme|nr:GNAT family N-acetyltransferase [Deltaproteobacteria bacterium]
MTDILLRPLTPDDLSATLSIEKASFPHDPWSLEDFLDEMERPCSNVIGLFTPALPLSGGKGRPGRARAAPSFLKSLKALPEPGRAKRSLPWPPAGAPCGPPARPAGAAAFAAAPVSAYAVFWLLYGEAHLLNFAVAPERRREGLGRALLRSVLAASRALGQSRALLECRANNRAALALYASEGFRRLGRRKGYYEGGRTDAVVMALNLRPEAG